MLGGYTGEGMKITKIEDLHADGGWRTLSFLKITTDEGLVGWSEFHEGRAVPGLTAVIRELAKSVVGLDPRAISRISAMLYALTRTTAGGMISQAIAAIENACLDIKAKSLGVPVYELFGGAVRDRLPMYWSHCGTLRARYPDLFGTTPLRTLDDIVRLGQEVAARGFKSLKTNILVAHDRGLQNYRSGFGSGPGHPELNLDGKLLGSITDTLAAFRQGAGEETGLLIDLNFNFKPEAVRQIARAVEPFRLVWLEVDMYQPEMLSFIRRSTATPIGSLETIYGRRNMRPYLDNLAVDVAIVDPQWNGMVEATRMATLADAYEVNVACHNYHGHLSTLMGAHFSAALPNFRIFEMLVDEVPWMSDFLTHPIVIENGEFVVPCRPGWGSDINQDAIEAHPPK
jgi:galactonate dehydratase